MAEITESVVTFFGLRCDKRGCSAELLLPEPIVATSSYSSRAEAALKVLAPAHGWSLWVHRWREWRCPDHPMQPPTGLRKHGAFVARRVLPREEVARG